jgi:hypothetical protein
VEPADEGHHRQPQAGGERSPAARPDARSVSGDPAGEFNVLICGINGLMKNIIRSLPDTSMFPLMFVNDGRHL